MNFNPVTFTEVGSKLSSKTISIFTTGGFLFSSGLVHHESLSAYSHCILSYDADARAIFFEFTSDKNALGAITITHRKENNGTATSRSFFQYFKLTPKDLAGRYEAKNIKLNRGEQRLMISLKERLTK